MKEALKLALEALRMADELCGGHGVDFKEYGLEFDRDIQVKYKDAITAIKEALAQPEQEPVGFIEAKADNECADAYADGWNACVHAHKDTTPPKREWVGLTDEDIGQWIEEEHDVLRWADAKLKEKNT